MKKQYSTPVAMFVGYSSNVKYALSCSFGSTNDLDCRGNVKFA